MIVLDTHAWIWWVDGSRHLSARARRAIDRSPEVGVSPISCWEVAMLVRKGRLELDRDVARWVLDALQVPRVRLLPLSAEIAVAAGIFGDDFHGDPADRLLAATAMHIDASLVTKDERLHALPGLKTLW